MSAALLPPNATLLERALASVVDDLVTLFDPLAGAWNADDIPAAFLPWLAAEWSVDVWDPDWSEEQMREAIRAAVEIHRIKGSPASVIRAIEAMGYGVGELIEGWSNVRYDGTATYDGSYTHQSSDHWAEYRVRMMAPISIAQADAIRAVCARTAPARSRLKELDFTQAANLYDGAILHDGAFTHGVV